MTYKCAVSTAEQFFCDIFGDIIAMLC